jgi:hypothetical protein
MPKMPKPKRMTPAENNAATTAWIDRLVREGHTAPAAPTGRAPKPTAN